MAGTRCQLMMALKSGKGGRIPLMMATAGLVAPGLALAAASVVVSMGCGGTWWCSLSTPASSPCSSSSSVVPVTPARSDSSSDGCAQVEAPAPLRRCGPDEEDDRLLELQSDDAGGVMNESKMRLLSSRILVKDPGSSE